MEPSIQIKYTDFIIDALKNIEKEYYLIKTTYGEIVRERVFCYEFYHQMRLLQDHYEIKNISLSAEIDKRGHIDIKRDERRNPDFVIHQYGTFDKNEILIEVKGKLGRGLFKDFRTLNLYLKRYKYKHAYFILYNHNLEELKNYIASNKEYINMKKEKMIGDFTVICKKDVDSECEVSNGEILLALI